MGSKYPKTPLSTSEVKDSKAKCKDKDYMTSLSRDQTNQSQVLIPHPKSKKEKKHPNSQAPHQVTQLEALKTMIKKAQV